MEFIAEQEIFVKTIQEFTDKAVLTCKSETCEDFIDEIIEDAMANTEFAQSLMQQFKCKFYIERVLAHCATFSWLLSEKINKKYYYDSDDSDDSN